MKLINVLVKNFRIGVRSYWDLIEETKLRNDIFAIIDKEYKAIWRSIKEEAAHYKGEVPGDNKSPTYLQNQLRLAVIINFIHGLYRKPSLRIYAKITSILQKLLDERAVLCPRKFIH
jgi:hypothetical protein